MPINPKVDQLFKQLDARMDKVDVKIQTLKAQLKAKANKKKAKKIVTPRRVGLTTVAIARQLVLAVLDVQLSQ